MSYDDYTRGLRRIRLSFKEAKAAYICRSCGENMGCGHCLDDIAGLICRNCHDWANDISEQVHGRMVKDSELKQQGMKLIRMRYQGQINDEEYNKLWAQARAVLRSIRREEGA